MILCIVQARLSSTRLPGKVLRPILGRPMIDLQLERLARATTLDRIVIATSAEASDDPIAAYAASTGIGCHRGSLDDVVDRFRAAAEAFGPADHVVRSTADCPLIDPAIVDRVVRHHLADGADYTSNAVVRSFADGLDIEVMSRATLEIAWREATTRHDREHVTPFIYRAPDRFRISHLVDDVDRSALRWTVDTVDDFDFVSDVFSKLYPTDPMFDSAAVLALPNGHRLA